MEPSLTIGNFAQATHLSVKTLRHYHRIGLLEPAQVDPATGYRRYAIAQIPTAQVIRRFRSLDMPLEEILAVITAQDLDARNALIAAHLDRLEVSLARTQTAVASLNELLRNPSPFDVGAIVHQTFPDVLSAAISETIDVEDASTWYQGALGELRAVLAAQKVRASAPAGGVYSTELFTHARGRATVFIPSETAVKAVGRVSALVVPAVELATIQQSGPAADLDRAYGALAAYVTQHALAIDGPLREYYLVNSDSTPDEIDWVTEIGWPIFRTDSPSAP